jgi:magnesium-transporting ATPase (P-type)
VLFIKGSPEKLLQLSNIKIENFLQKSEEYCNLGYRSLALGFKVLTGSEKELDERIINNITISSLVFFENDLK